MGNANSGRRPAPTALTLLRGNPSKKRIGVEPTPPPGPVEKPAGLSGVASLVWDELAPVCLAMGTLTTADRYAFATLCELQATVRAASAAKDVEGFTAIRTAESVDGAITVSVDAAIKLEQATAATLRPYYAMFGLEPSARARLAKPGTPGKTGATVSKWAGALK